MRFFGYLRRNPNDLPDADYTGYEFWLNKLNQFNGNYNAAEMVKAFITSTEGAQSTGACLLSHRRVCRGAPGIATRSGYESQ